MHSTRTSALSPHWQDSRTAAAACEGGNVFYGILQQGFLAPTQNQLYDLPGVWIQRESYPRDGPDRTLTGKKTGGVGAEAESTYPWQQS